MPDRTIYFITGPTASGKSAAAVDLALAVGGEVISADSIQIYKYLNIGSAKPTIAEMRGVPHHMIDVLEPEQPCSAALFQQLAGAAVAEVRSRGKVPIVAGGSGFYLNALVYGTHFEGGGMDSMAREKYERLGDERGTEYLYRLLAERDPASAAIIHPNNVKRVMRALAFLDETGETMSGQNSRERQRSLPPNTRLFILTMERAKLYKRIDRRVEEMFGMGLAEEVRGLLNMGYSPELPSMKSVGYKETVQYVQGRLSLEEAKEQIKYATHHLAKRQLTWFRNRCPGAEWIDLEKEALLDKMPNIWK